MANAVTSTRARALELLGNGVAPAQVAAALGITESAISQLVSDPEFSAQVAELRFQKLSKYNERDDSYDSIEDSLIEKLRDLMPMMMRPMEVLKAIQVINAAKRRGASAPSDGIQHQTIIQLNMPSAIIQKFSTTINNQVTNAGSQELLTIQSSHLLDKIRANSRKENGEQDGQQLLAATTN